MPDNSSGMVLEKYYETPGHCREQGRAVCTQVERSQRSLRRNVLCMDGFQSLRLRGVGQGRTFFSGLCTYTMLHSFTRACASFISRKKEELLESTAI